MVPPPDLDEELQAKVLACVTEPRASLACVTWKALLYKSLHLQSRARFYTQIHDKGRVTFCYSAARPLGEEVEESVGYNFTFERDGTYNMQWTRTFGPWSTQCEQQFGAWSLILDCIHCETQNPREAISDRQVYCAPPGYTFRVPVEDILDANGACLMAPPGSPAASWELPARTGKHADESSTAKVAGMWESVEVAPAAEQAIHAPARLDARFVEIDGEMQEVSGDIVANWPEQDWPRLMRCRLRFGISG